MVNKALLYGGGVLGFAGFMMLFFVPMMSGWGDVPGANPNDVKACKTVVDISAVRHVFGSTELKSLSTSDGGWTGDTVRAGKVANNFNIQTEQEEREHEKLQIDIIDAVNGRLIGSKRCGVGWGELFGGTKSCSFSVFGLASGHEFQVKGYYISAEGGKEDSKTKAFTPSC